MCIKKQKAREEKPEDNTFDPVKSFLPVRDTIKNNAVKYVMNALNYSIDKAKALLDLIFDTACAENILIQNADSSKYDSYVIDAKKYKFYSYTTSMWILSPIVFESFSTNNLRTYSFAFQFQ
jgi:hypothetical protein